MQFTRTLDARPGGEKQSTPVFPTCGGCVWKELTQRTDLTLFWRAGAGAD